MRKEKNAGKRRECKKITVLFLSGELNKFLLLWQRVVICFNACKSKSPDVKRSESVAMYSIHK